MPKRPPKERGATPFRKLPTFDQVEMVIICSIPLGSGIAVIGKFIGWW